MSESADTARERAHPATAKAWEWFEAHEPKMDADRRERIFLTLAQLDVSLWKLTRDGVSFNEVAR